MESNNDKDNNNINDNQQEETVGVDHADSVVNNESKQDANSSTAPNESITASIGNSQEASITKTTKKTSKRKRNNDDNVDNNFDNDDDDKKPKKNPVEVDLLSEKPLVLTSEKRQNAYECDYCHQDISQQPRIRCAVCTDFDLCLDCFATSDHQAMILRIKMSSYKQQKQQHGSGKDGLAIPSAAANHDVSHGYHVCDSTRYQVFPSGRIIAPPTSTTTTTTTSTAAATAKSIICKGTEAEGDESNDEANRTAVENVDVDVMDIDLPDTTAKSESEETGDAILEDTKSASSSTSTHVPFNIDAVSVVSEVAISEDPKFVWTAEEDLRLIDAIRTHGLGNWNDVSEAISGNGSVGKTPKRCMERYFDDFLGRYGHILPLWTVVTEDVEDNNGATESSTSLPTGEERDKERIADMEVDGVPAKLAKSICPSEGDDEEKIRSSKRQRTSTSRITDSLLAQAYMTTATRSKKKLKVVLTESLPNYDSVWPNPYLPPTGVRMSQEVARDLSYKAELTFVKASLAATSKEEADKIRKDWMENRMGQIGSPTVLPPRPEDFIHLPGSDLGGYMPRRGDFDVEWDNDAEQALADMEFLRVDTPQEKQLKLQVLDIYCQKLDEREKRKNFILKRHLYDYRKYIQDEQKLPMDERDLVHRMRMFERFHTPEEHQKFIADILKAKRLRKEIAKLQMYRRIGIRTLVEAEKYELDKNRRQFHKIAQMQREADAKAKGLLVGSASAIGGTGKTSTFSAGVTPSSATASQRVPVESLWKQYKTSRRSSSRSGNLKSDEDNKVDDCKETINGAEESDKKVEENKIEEADLASETKPGDTAQDKNIQIDVDGLDSGNTKDSKCEQSTSNEVENKLEGKKEAQEEEFNISLSRGCDLLSKQERGLCEHLRIYPAQYLEFKKALIHEALINGLLDESSSGRRSIVKVDVERRGDIINFLVRAGWISRKLGDAAMRVVTPQPEVSTPF